MSLPFSSMVFLYSPVIFYHFLLKIGLFLGKLTTYKKKIARLRERRNSKTEQKKTGFPQNKAFHLSGTGGLSKHLTIATRHHTLPPGEKKPDGQNRPDCSNSRLGRCHVRHSGMYPLFSMMRLFWLSSIFLHMRTAWGVTSTSSSSLMNLMACSSVIFDTGVSATASS